MPGPTMLPPSYKWGLSGCNEDLMGPQSLKYLLSGGKKKKEKVPIPVLDQTYPYLDVLLLS